MTTEVEPLIVEFTDEEHEQECEFQNLGCPRVAVWRAVFLNVSCGHDRLCCQEHKEVAEEYDRSGDRLGWLCGRCGVLGGYGIRWERP